MRVALAIPSDDQVKTDFALSLAWMMRTTKIDVVPINVRTSLISVSRFELVKNAQKFECDKIFFIDSDLIFPEDSLERLLSHDKDIVGATYVKRRTGQILGIALNNEGIPSGSIGIHRMAWMPIGFGLIDIKVFDNIPKPWFPIKYREDLGEIQSEDYCFCDLATQAGYELWCDLDLSHELGHIGSQTLVWSKPKPQN